MEPQETIYCYDNREQRCCCNKKVGCLNIATIILLTAFALVIGLIIGAALSTALLTALASLIVLAVILGLLLIIMLILTCCFKKKLCKCNK